MVSSLFDWFIQHLPGLPLSLPPFTVEMLLLHALGDYVLQSEWMAYEKTRKTWVALTHGLFYSIGFVLFLTPSWQAWAIIVGTHAVIDRFRLARYICYLKNFLAPPRTRMQVEETSNPEGSFHVRRTKWKTLKWWKPWKECAVTGYPDDTVPYLSLWLVIIVDNLLHVVINAYALKYF